MPRPFQHGDGQQFQKPLDIIRKDLHSNAAAQHKDWHRLHSLSHSSDSLMSRRIWNKDKPSVFGYSNNEMEEMTPPFKIYKLFMDARRFME